MKFLLLFFVPLLSFSADQTFRARLVEDLGTLDWNYGEVNPEVVYQLMEGLFRADVKGQPVLAAAKSYSWKENKTKLTVRLRNDRKWSDGAPLCAQHFVDSWNRLLSKEFGSPYAHYAHVLKRFETKGCDTLELEFKRASPEALALLAHYVFFPVRLDNLKAQPKAFNEGTSLLVNGPYRVKEWKANQLLLLEGNPSFGGAKPKVARVEFYFVPDESTAMTMFQQKRIDWMKDVPLLLRTPQLEKSAEFRMFPSFTTYYFGLNAGKSKLLESPDVRRALSQALDRSQIAKVLGKENRGVSTWLMAEVFPKLKAPKDESFLNVKVLQDAQKAGKMDLVLRVYSKSAHRLLAEWAQGQWEKKLGVRIPIEVQDGKVYWKEITTNPAPIFLSGVTAPYGHPRAFLQEFLSTSTANWTGWSSSAYDKAVDEESFQEAEELLMKGGFVIPLYARNTVALVNPKWKGFHINPLGQIFLSDLR